MTPDLSLLFYLGSVDDDMMLFRPLALFRNVFSEQEVITSPPVALQVYAVADYEEGQILGADRRNDFLLVNYRGAASPIDINQAGNSITLQLFSEHTGKIRIERR